MTTLLAVDPSVNSAGAAVYRDGVLMASARITCDVEGSHGARCMAMAWRIAEWARAARPDIFAFEWPQIYAGSKQKTDPNDLPGLAGVGVGVAAYLAPRQVLSPTPAQWSGQVPKTVEAIRKGKRVRVKPKDPWTTPRGIRVWERLSPAERMLVQAQHDVIDAVAIGLWCLGRFEVRRAMPGAV